MFSGLANYLFGSTNSDSTSNNNKKGEEDNNFLNKRDLTETDNLKFLSIETEEDDWLIVDKEVEEESLPRTDSEEELPFVEIKNPKNQRYKRHNRNGQNAGNINRNLIDYDYSDETSQPLYVVSNEINNETMAIVGPSNGLTPKYLEESWFLTPPPCFTSTGPINMETSPFENLLIEHPSMSVYHSIRSAQEAATESFINLDLGAEETVTLAQPKIKKISKHNATTNQRNSNINRTNNNNRMEHHLSNQNIKENLLLRKSQKIKDKKERQNIGRGALKRGNKTREGKNLIKRNNCKNNGRQNYLWSAKQKS